MKQKSETEKQNAAFFRRRLLEGLARPLVGERLLREAHLLLRGPTCDVIAREELGDDVVRSGRGGGGKW
jgi:hypothetical protein